MDEGAELKQRISRRYAATIAGLEGSAVGAPGTSPPSVGDGESGADGGCCCRSTSPQRVHAAADGGRGCCGGGSVIEGPGISRGLYGSSELDEVPQLAAAASLGCGNPVARAELRPGEVVLDLGSGGGIDVLLSAQRVAPHGKAYGLDMTDDMLALARRNQREAGVENAEFLRGDIESMPLDDASVDVIISNCVINLAADKDAVLREAWRVLRPGGRLAISDMVYRGDPALLPARLREDIDAWSGCVAGALGWEDYRQRLQRVGFDEVSLEETRSYDQELLERLGEAPPEGVRLVAALVRAVKPAA